MGNLRPQRCRPAWTGSDVERHRDRCTDDTPCTASESWSQFIDSWVPRFFVKFRVVEKLDKISALKLCFLQYVGRQLCFLQMYNFQFYIKT
jgi:hypothetical protein